MVAGGATSLRASEAPLPLGLAGQSLGGFQRESEWREPLMEQPQSYSLQVSLEGVLRGALGLRSPLGLAVALDTQARTSQATNPLQAT